MSGHGDDMDDDHGLAVMTHGEWYCDGGHNHSPAKVAW